MSESTTGMVYFGVVVLICSMLAHALQKQFWLATGLASLASTALIQIIVILQIGYLDPYFPIAIAITMIISAVCAALVGVLFLILRKLKEN